MNRTAFRTCAAVALFSPWAAAHAVTLQATGQVGVTVETLNSLPPSAAVSQAWKFPFSLTLSVRPTDRLNLSVNLNSGQLHNPLLGGENTGAALTAGKPSSADNTQLPLMPQNRGRSNGLDAQIGYAYATYEADTGARFLVGRIPTHWGLGLWRNSEFRPEGGSISTIDAVAAELKFQSVKFGIALEKYAEGSATNQSDDVDGQTYSAVVEDDLADTSSSGVSRQIGVAYSRVVGKATSTEVGIIDVFGRVFVGNSLVEGELFFPNGSTRSPLYADLGGNGVCGADQNSDAASEGLTCSGQKIEGLGALLKVHYTLGSTPSDAYSITAASLEATNRIRVVPSANRKSSDTIGFWVGYASGSRNAFAGQKSEDTVRLTSLHTNIRPALLMYSSALPDVAGMPGHYVQNTLFARAEYVADGTNGTFTLAGIYGRLATTNPSTDEKAWGRDANLGFEVDGGWSFTTTDRLTLGVDAGAYFPGNAWKNSDGKSDWAYGLRMGASTQF